MTTHDVSSAVQLVAILSSPSVMPGDTVQLAAGTYTAATFTSTLVGTSEARITVRSQAGQRVTIDANVRILGSYTRWEGIEFYSPGATDRTSVQQTSAPSDISGRLLTLDPVTAYTQIINCIIHDAPHGISGTGNGCEFYGNLIYYIGWDYPTNTYGHGIYPHNSSPIMRIADNLIFDNFGYGLHAYADSGKIDNLTVEGNTFFNNGSLRSEPAYEPNIQLGGHVDVANPVVRDNVSYYPTADDVGLNRVGYGQNNTVTGARITGNLFVGEVALALVGCVPVDFSNNRIYGFTSGFVPGNYPTNTYGVPSACPAQSIVRANEYRAGRGHVTIINPTSADTVSIDVSSVLEPYSAYNLYNAQDYYSDIQTGVVAEDGTILIDMRFSQHTVAAPVGWTPPMRTFPKFGAFVLEEIPPEVIRPGPHGTVIYREIDSVSTLVSRYAGSAL